MRATTDDAKRFWALALALTVGVAVALLCAARASAATVEVTAGGDGAGAECTLRHAIETARTDTDTGGCTHSGAFGEDTVEVPASIGPVIQLGSELGIPFPSGPITVEGPGASLLDVRGGAGFRVFRIGSEEPVTIAGLTISGGREVGTTEAQGGGIYATGFTDVTLDHVVVTDNRATATLESGSPTARGGGISAFDLTIRASTISGNKALASVTSGAGSLPATYGGGISASSLVIEDSTINTNSAVSTPSGPTGMASAQGGGVMVGSGSGNTVVLSRATVVENVAIGQTTGKGGGIYSAAAGGTAFASDTVAHNQATEAGNLAIQDATFANTIVSEPFGGANCVDLKGAGVSLTSEGHNLEQGESGCGFGSPTDLVNVPIAGFGAELADNGGPTETMSLEPGSAAIDAGQAAPFETADQRGLARPVDFPSLANAEGGDGTDIGAFELQQACPGQVTPGASCAKEEPKTTTPGPAAPIVGPTPVPPGVVTLVGRSATAVKGRIPLKLRCRAGAPCEGSLSLATAKKIALRAGGPKRHLVLGSAGFSIAAGQTKAIKVRLNATTRQLLTRFDRLPALVKITTKSRGEKRTATAPLAIRAGG